MWNNAGRTQVQTTFLMGSTKMVQKTKHKCKEQSSQNELKRVNFVRQSYLWNTSVYNRSRVVERLKWLSCWLLALLLLNNCSIRSYQCFIKVASFDRIPKGRFSQMSKWKNTLSNDVTSRAMVKFREIYGQKFQPCVWNLTSKS